MSQTKAQLLDGKSATIQFTGGSASAPSVSFTGDTNTGIYSPGADQLAISTNGTGRLFVDSSGNIGINYSTPSNFASGDLGATAPVVIGDGTATRNLTLFGANNGYGSVAFADSTTGSAKYAGLIQYYHTDNSLQFYTNSTERLRITSTGLVGVGTSSVSTILHVNAGATADTNVRLQIGGTSGNHAKHTYADATNTVQWTSGWRSSTNTFGINVGDSFNSTGLTIDSSGRLGVGTTSPAKQLHIENTSSDVTLRIGRNGYVQTDLIGSTGAGANDFKITQNGFDRFVIEYGGNSAARIDSSGRLGIGASSISEQLQLGQNGSGTDNYIGIWGDQSGSNGEFAGIKFFNNQANASATPVKQVASIYAARDGDNFGGALYFQTANTSSGSQTLGTRMLLDSSGRLGIGTTNVPAPFCVSRSGNEGLEVTPLTGNQVEIQGYNRTTSNWVAALNKFSQHIWNLNSTTEAARIDTSGRLLVGTSTVPSSVNSQIQFVVEQAGNYANAVLATNNNNPDGAYLTLQKSRSTSANGNTIVQNNDELGTILFVGTDGASKRVGALITGYVDGTPGANDMPGRLVFSTTPDSGSSPVERLRIFSGGGFSVYSSTTGNDTIDSCNSQGAGTTYSTFIGRHSASGTTSGTVSIRIYTNGNVVNTNNSYGSISDIKLKENIVDANSQWDDIKALQVRKYNFKEGQTHTQIGLIAQEVELVSPGLVTESPDRDAEGNDLGTVTKSVNYSVLYMKAVKALQEAMERIEQLESEMVAVKAQLS